MVSGTTTEEPDPFARTVHFVPTEPFFPNQWHLLNLGQTGGPAGIDINVTSVWDDYDGTGIGVGVYDDSVQYTHHDLDAHADRVAGPERDADAVDHQDIDRHPHHHADADTKPDADGHAYGDTDDSAPRRSGGARLRHRVRG